MSYIAVGVVVKSNHPRLKVGNVIATEMRKKYSMSEPYPMILMVDDTLTTVEVIWKEFVKIDSRLPQEQKDFIMRELIEKWSKQKTLIDILNS